MGNYLYPKAQKEQLAVKKFTGSQKNVLESVNKEIGIWCKGNEVIMKIDIKEQLI